MEWDRQNILSFWTVFCPFNPLWTQKIKILKKKPPKTPGDIIILKMRTINNNYMMSDPDIWSGTDKFFYYFGSFFEYNAGRYHNFKKVTQKS